MQLTSSIKENPKLQAAAEELKKSGLKISDAVSEAVRSLEASGFYQGVRLDLRVFLASPYNSITDHSGDSRHVVSCGHLHRAHPKYRGI